MTVRLYLWQRLTGALMVPLVLAHIVLILYATGHDLSASDILGRTRGSVGWALFYGVFVVLVAIHASIGVRAVASEWTRLGERSLELLTWSFGLVLLLLGLRAVAAVVFT